MGRWSWAFAIVGGLGCQGHHVVPPRPSAPVPPVSLPAPADPSPSPAPGECAPLTLRALTDAVTAIRAELSRLHGDLELVSITTHHPRDGATVTAALDAVSDHTVFVLSDAAVVAQPNKHGLAIATWMVELTRWAVSVSSQPLVHSEISFGPKAAVAAYELSGCAQLVHYRKPIAALVDAAARAEIAQLRADQRRATVTTCGAAAVARCEKRHCVMLVDAERSCPGGVRPSPSDPDRGGRPSCICECGTLVPTQGCSPMP
ncbi:MAG: hypothetical protein NT062_35630 [Proteobacteria bacterium]|nr:hypothetical protein [Pseudomonadota bacterium]